MKISRLEQFKGHLYQRLKWEDLDPAYLIDLIGLAHDEDIAGFGLLKNVYPAGDVTTSLLGENLEASAVLSAREEMVLCGLPLLEIVLNVYGGEGAFFIKPLAKEGDLLTSGQRIAEIFGPAPILLGAERIILNFLQRLSGIATETKKYADALTGSKTCLLDTRKTTPGYRMLEKYAVACGGGWNHRLGVFDRVMLKDNHLAVLGAVGDQRLTEAVALAVKERPDYVIEVEVDRLDQIMPVVEAGADVIMLDNFSTEDMVQAIKMIDGRALTEASGGITIGRLGELKFIGLDYISTGALVHKSIWKDIGLDWA